MQLSYKGKKSVFVRLYYFVLSYENNTLTAAINLVLNLNTTNVIRPMTNSRGPQNFHGTTQKPNLTTVDFPSGIFRWRVAV